MRAFKPESKSMSSKFKPACYWGWLDKIEPDEVRWQIQQMHEVGLGGYIMHARGGKRIPYMGEEWMQCVQAMIGEGKRLDMLTWIDDEDGWPSGFGAGKVTALGEEYWQKYLVRREIAPDQVERSKYTLGVYALYGQSIKVVNPVENPPKDADKLVEICYRVDRYYTDLMDKHVVRAFIDSSHELYFERFGSEFGKSVAGIFTDEPQLRRGFLEGSIPWSLVIPEEFEQEVGYDIIEALPALYYKVDGYQKVRYDFWKTVNRLFVDAYSKQISDWCNMHRCIHTGHVVLEESLATQIPTSGGVMPFYEYMQLPGIDWLCRCIGDHIVPKQLSSVCHQLGKEQALSEMFGCAGWNVSFEELKWIAEWQYVLGVNYMAQHLGLYSLRGARKREYPASLFYQQPWWKEFTCFNEYFSRLSYLLTQGEPVVDVLMIHPLRSGWIAYDADMEGDIKILDQELAALTEYLLQLHYDFHYGDEALLARYGKVENGELKIGFASYKLVIIPPSISLDKTTIDLLEQFLQIGGKILSVGDFPVLCEGLSSDRLDQFKNSIPLVANDKLMLKQVLKELMQSRVEIVDEEGRDAESIFYCHRRRGNEGIYYFVNTSREEAVDACIFLWEKGPIQLYDLGNDMLQPVQGVETGFSDGLDRSCIRLCFAPTQSHVLVCGANRDLPSESIVYEKDVVTIGSEWNIESMDENALTLDYCQCSVEGNEYGERLPVIELQNQLMALGRPVWVKIKFEFEVDFELDDVTRDSLYLVVEDPQMYQSISLNGYEIDECDCGWWIDKSFRKLRVGSYVVRGTNRIVLERYFYCSDKVYQIRNSPEEFHESEKNRLTIDTELESVYLIGAFTVGSRSPYTQGERKSSRTQGPFVLEAPGTSVLVGDLVPQGFPFFAGRIKLSQVITLPASHEINRFVLRMADLNSPVANLWMNGRLVKTLMWQPYQIDITEHCVPGNNVLTFELVSSCRNLLGPHHHVAGELYGVGPFSYEKGGAWVDSYSFVKFGLDERIEIVTMTGTSRRKSK